MSLLFSRIQLNVQFVLIAVWVFISRWIQMRVIEIAIIVKFDCLYTKIIFFISRSAKTSSQHERYKKRVEVEIKSFKFIFIYYICVCLLQLFELKLVWLRWEDVSTVNVASIWFSSLTSIDLTLKFYLWTERERTRNNNNNIIFLNLRCTYAFFWFFLQRNK